MRLFPLLLLILLSITTRAQTETTERVIGAQLGYLGTWAYGEFPVGDRTAVRTELGVDVAFSSRGGFFGDGTLVAAVPAFTVSPRWYYNLRKRFRGGKATAKNTANFFSLRTTLNPGWTIASNDSRTIVSNALYVFPSWGIRRHLGKVSFETGLGIGYGRQWYKGRSLESGVDGTIYLRFGI